jgi:hypothetical protein
MQTTLAQGELVIDIGGRDALDDPTVCEIDPLEGDVFLLQQ